MALTREQVDAAAQRLAMAMNLGGLVRQLFQRLASAEAATHLTPQHRKAFRVVWQGVKLFLTDLLSNPLAPIEDGEEFSQADAQIADVKMQQFLELLGELDRGLSLVYQVGEVNPLTDTELEWTPAEWVIATTKLQVLLQKAKARLSELP